jgi:iron-sulfur cluster repair protein YtfE (RIC family)
MPDVVDLIEQDHREVEQLFEQFESTRDLSIPATICDELDRHTSGEEQVVYPAIASDVPGGKKMVEEAVGEHEEARQMIGRIRRTEDPEEVAELVGTLKEAIEHHVQEEESEVLPKTRDALDAARLDALGSEFEAAKGS